MRRQASPSHSEKNACEVALAALAGIDPTGSGVADGSGVALSGSAAAAGTVPAGCGDGDGAIVGPGVAPARRGLLAGLGVTSEELEPGLHDAKVTDGYMLIDPRGGPRDNCSRTLEVVPLQVGWPGCGWRGRRKPSHC